MKRVAILGIRSGWHCEQLRGAFQKRGVDSCFVTADNIRCASGFENGKGCDLEDYDSIVIRGIPAGSLEQIIYRMDALYMLERRGMPFINSPKSIEKTVDKYYTTALLEEAGLPVPPTVCCEGREEDIANALHQMGGDMVYKPIFGSCGNGLMRIRSREDMAPLIKRIAEKGSVAYLQKFIPCSNSDIRAFVINGQVRAAMKRTGSDWYANWSRGGRAEACSLTPYEEQLAVKAAEAVNADIAGVDIIRGDDGSTYVIEVNGCPGWQGLSTVTDVDIAEEIADFVLSKI